MESLLDEIGRQRALNTRAHKGAQEIHQAMQQQLLLETNRRFDNVLQVIRELQKNLNLMTPAGIKERILQIVNTDPLIPRADKFEKDLEAMEKALRESEVAMVQY